MFATGLPRPFHASRRLTWKDCLQIPNEIVRAHACTCAAAPPLVSSSRVERKWAAIGGSETQLPDVDDSAAQAGPWGGGDGDGAAATACKWVERAVAAAGCKLTERVVASKPG